MRRYIALIIAIKCLIGVLPVLGQSTQWIQQFGTSKDDIAEGISADGIGNIFVSGQTTDRLDLVPRSAVLSKFSEAGTLLWSHQLNDGGLTSGIAVSADKLGSVFLAGNSFNTIGQQFPNNDLNLNKYDTNGNLIWARQLGTPTTDEATRVVADGLGNVYVGGDTAGPLFGPSPGAFLTKFDSTGNLLWSRQFGVFEDDAHGLSIDASGNVYISGSTRTNLGGTFGGYVDAYVRKYDSTGNLLWTRQVGPPEGAHSACVSVDALGNVFVSGTTDGNLEGPLVGVENAFLLKYDQAGTLIWGRQFGTSHQTDARAAFADGLGNVFVTGWTDGSLADGNAGGFDVYLRKYDSSGNVIWTRQIASPDFDIVYSGTTDSNFNAYIAGYTTATIGDASFGGWDAYVAKFAGNTVPEPTTEIIACIALIIASSIHRTRTRQTIAMT